MGIDKTTGKGCAWSITSKTITKKLVADGIVNRAISRKPCKNGYMLLRVHKYGGNWLVSSEKDNAQTEEPLWVPSFIDTETWKQAVSEFQLYRELDQNIEKYLLPYMEEYLQSISDEELLSITRDFLIEQGVINKPVAQNRGKTYYFNEDEIYSIDKEARLFPYEKRVKFNIFEIRGEICFNMNVWHKAVSQFEVGMTLEECIRRFLNTKLVHRVPQKLSSVDRLVQYISPPTYERTPENDNESTFDRIRMTVGLPRYQFDSWGALRNEVGKYQNEISQRVIHKLGEDRQFRKYGVPMNFLKLSDVVLLRDFSMEFIFELKEQTGDSH